MKKQMPWFRFYTEALDDPKVQRLPPHLFKTWVNLLCLAGANGGKFPSIDDIAFRLRLSPTDAGQQIDELILAGLIDIGASGEREPHNWQSRQFVSDSSTERVRKHRKQKEKQECNANETLHETTPETDTESETDTEAEVTTVQSEYDAPREKSVGGSEAFADLKRMFNGSTEAMLVFAERSMGGSCRRNAEQWLSTTVAAYGQTAVAQAFAILVEKQAAGEISSRPLPHWSSLARGIKSRAPAPRAGKRTLADALRDFDDKRIPQ